MGERRGHCVPFTCVAGAPRRMVERKAPHDQYVTSTMRRGAPVTHVEGSSGHVGHVASKDHTLIPELAALHRSAAQPAAVYITQCKVILPGPTPSQTNKPLLFNQNLGPVENSFGTYGGPLWGSKLLLFFKDPRRNFPGKRIVAPREVYPFSDILLESPPMIPAPLKIWTKCRPPLALIG
eukprot:gene18686-biopygen2440